MFNFVTHKTTEKPLKTKEKPWNSDVSRLSILAEWERFEQSIIRQKTLYFQCFHKSVSIFVSIFRPFTISDTSIDISLRAQISQSVDHVSTHTPPWFPPAPQGPSDGTVFLLLLCLICASLLPIEKPRRFAQISAWKYVQIDGTKNIDLMNLKMYNGIQKVRWVNAQENG